MLNISKYHKLIVGCSAIATAAIGGFVPSADAAGTHNQTAQSQPSVTLIADASATSHNPPPAFNCSNCGSFSTGGSNANGTRPGPGGFFDSNNGGKGLYFTDAKGRTYYYDSNNGGTKGDKGVKYYYDSNNGGKNGPGFYTTDSNNGGKGPAYFYKKDGPNGPGYYSYDSNNGGTDPKPKPIPGTEPKPIPGTEPKPIPGTEPKPIPGTEPLTDPRGPIAIGPDGKPIIGPDGKPVIAKNGSDGGATDNASFPGGSSGSGSGGRPGFNPTLIALAKASFGRIGIAQGKYDAALAALAAAEAATPNTSSSTSPVRYGREPGDIAACGCPNADTTTAGTPSKELVAAKAAEAEAAAELAAAKAEARQFLESVKGGTGSGADLSIW